MKSDHMGEKHLRLKMENLEIFENYYYTDAKWAWGCGGEEFLCHLCENKNKGKYILSLDFVQA